MLRVFRSRVPSPHAQPHAQAVVARWNDIMNSSARAMEASTYSGPSTSRRIGMPLWNRASSSAMSSPPASHHGCDLTAGAPPGSTFGRRLRRSDPYSHLPLQRHHPHPEHRLVADVDIVLPNKGQLAVVADAKYREAGG